MKFRVSYVICCLKILMNITWKLSLQASRSFNRFLHHFNVTFSDKMLVMVIWSLLSFLCRPFIISLSARKWLSICESFLFCYQVWRRQMFTNWQQQKKNSWQHCLIIIILFSGEIISFVWKKNIFSKSQGFK